MIVSVLRRRPVSYTHLDVYKRQVSLCSGLNNLKDVTLDPRTATVCGYTHAELINSFADYLDGVDLEEVRRWYNGYNFLGEPVYNPFDVLLYLDNREFKPYWFETGTPTFLIELLRQRQFVIPEADDYLSLIHI